MKIPVQDLTVYFPFDFIYPEQYSYMNSLYTAIKAQGHAALEMPCGTGKTITLLSLILSYQWANRGTQKAQKLIYCTRTVGEMDKVLEELKGLTAFMKKEIGDHFNLLAVGLSSRSNLCIHPTVSQKKSALEVDSGCREKTAYWVRESSQKEFEHLKNQTNDLLDIEDAAESLGLCKFYEKFQKGVSNTEHPVYLSEGGVYTMNDLREYGKKNGLCPYFTARRALEYANVVVYSYSYMLDPKIAPIVSSSFDRNAIVVFDEAHNIDSVCVQALSIKITKNTIYSSNRNIKDIAEQVKRLEMTNHSRLQEEYNRLVNGLAAPGIGRGERLTANPVLPQDILNEAVPGNIRKARHFVNFLRRLSTFVEDRLNTKRTEINSPEEFLIELQNATLLTKKELRFTSERLYSLLNTLEVGSIDQYYQLIMLGDFATLLGTYQEGFTVIIEPFDERTPTFLDPTLQLCCLDASISIKNVFEKFQTVVITSGTLSPLNFYSKLLDFVPVVSNSFKNTLPRECICPIIVSRGNDQVAISTSYKTRGDKSVIQNFGNLLLELTSTVPDGIICFFTSYQYMEDLVCEWHKMGILHRIRENKLVYVETPNSEETSIALTNYRAACDCGRGAVFFSYARGKVAEGIDFEGHYGRAVVMFGVPFINTESKILRSRLAYLQRHKGIGEADFLNFDAMRNTAQCIGRVIRHKNDYGMMVLADKRYNRADKYKKLPVWINEHIRPERNMNLSTDAAIQLSRSFLIEMAQESDYDVVLRKTLFSEQDIIRMEQERLLALNQLQNNQQNTEQNSEQITEQITEQNQTEVMQDVVEIQSTQITIEAMDTTE